MNVGSHIKVANVPTATYYAPLLAPFGAWTFSTKPLCICPTLIVGRLPTFTLPATTSSAVIFSNLHNTFAPILTNYPYSAFEPKPPRTSHPTSILPMTTHTPPMTSAIAPLASPSRSWVMNPTPFYTVLTLPPSPTLPSSVLPALFVDMISAPGPLTPHSNKLQFSLGQAPLNPSANTTKHGLTLPPLHAHNSSTHSNLTFPNTNPPPFLGPYRPSSLPLPAPPLPQCQVCQSPFDEEKMLLCDICNAGWHRTASSPPSPPSLLGYGNVPGGISLLSPHPRAHYDISASHPPTLIKHHLALLGEKKP